jgi:hypothetical protein
MEDNHARRYEVPIQVYPEESLRSLTIVGTAVDTIVYINTINKRMKKG